MSVVIDVRELRKAYGGVVALDGVSFSVEEGEVFGVLGPPGAGKTTLAECVQGLRARDGGHLEVLGRDPAAGRAEVTGRLDAGLREGTATDRARLAGTLSLYGSFYRDPADWQRLVEAVGLSPGAPEGGLERALAEVGNPEVAVFDGLTAGLDRQAREETWELVESVRSGGTTVLLVTEHWEEAERLCDRVALMDRGRIAVTDRPDRLLARVRSGQRVQFRPSAPFDHGLLARLPGVSGVNRQGEQVVVTGTEGVLEQVTGLLAQHRVEARELRADQAALDAFLGLISRRSEP
ncbi:ATP-binding cassette domain-containing protein [Kitasatospora sp. NPDC057198]|uniref:ATP-binding cassette domain-containing protein n=1 Tax=Kitasatospora sp. NPDC057198 TaxID=3346046 RepID=UPI003634D9FB